MISVLFGLALIQLLFIAVVAGKVYSLTKQAKGNTLLILDVLEKILLQRRNK